jgi:hypothetical protein
MDFFTRGISQVGNHKVLLAHFTAKRTTKRKALRGTTPTEPCQHQDSSFHMQPINNTATNINKSKGLVDAKQAVSSVLTINTAPALLSQLNDSGVVAALQTLMSPHSRLARTCSDS